MTSLDAPLLIWDGECGFCRRCVRWVEAQPGGARYRAVPFQEAPQPPMTDGLREACKEAVHLALEDGRILRGGDAVLYVLSDLGWPLVGLLRWAPLLWFVELGYGVVARNRLLFSKWFFPCEDGGKVLGRRSAETCG